MKRTRGFVRLAVASAVAGFLATGGGVVLGSPIALHLGFTLWWFVFSAVVIENYRSGRPVPTRGGIVRKEDGSFRYALPYLGFGFMIVAGAVMLLTAWLMP
jgi:hypothetical protein